MTKKEKIDLLLKDKPNLICEKIYERDVEVVRAILELEEWKDSKFQGLLAPTIWKSNLENVKGILELKEWKDPKFQVLLTPTIWNSNLKEIKNIFQLSILQTEEYNYLLTPSIFQINLKNILPSIELFEEYGIGKYISNRCLRRNVELQRAFLQYLIDHNIELLVEGKDGYKLNPILNASNSELKAKYGIDIKSLSSKGAKK